MSKRKPSRRAGRKNRAAKIDWLIDRVLQSARDVVVKGADAVRATEEHRQTDCLLLIDGGDPVALAFYDDCLRAGMRAPARLKTHMVTTLRQLFDAVMGVAASHYQLAEHVEPPLGPGEVRAVVLTLGTLTVVHLDPSSTPVRASLSYHAVHSDVLLVAVAAWRNDRPEGFLLNAVFKNMGQGQRFMERYMVQLGVVEASGPTQDTIERQLLEFKAAYGRGEVPVEVQARVYAQVGWLERAGLLPDDRFNGLEFTFGCEMQLQESGKLVRMLGGPKDDLN